MQEDAQEKDKTICPDLGLMPSVLVSWGCYNKYTTD